MLIIYLPRDLRVVLLLVRERGCARGPRHGARGPGPHRGGRQGHLRAGGHADVVPASFILLRWTVDILHVEFELGSCKFIAALTAAYFRRGNFSPKVEAV